MKILMMFLLTLHTVNSLAGIDRSRINFDETGLRKKLHKSLKYYPDKYFWASTEQQRDRGFGYAGNLAGYLSKVDLKIIKKSPLPRTDGMLAYGMHIRSYFPVNNTLLKSFIVLKIKSNDGVSRYYRCNVLHYLKEGKIKKFHRGDCEFYNNH